jgi:hypothetical protein
MIPVTYFVIVPNTIRAAFSGNSSDQLVLEVVNITNVQDQGMEFRADAGIQRQSFLPGTFRLDPMRIQFGLLNGKELGTVSIVDSISVPINSYSSVPVRGNVTVQDMSSFGALLGGELKENGYKVALKTDITIQFWGITWYRNFPISTIYDFASNSDSGLAFSNSTNPIPKQLRNPDLNSEIRSTFQPSDLISLGPGLPDFVVQNLTLSRLDLSNFAMNCTLFYENPIKVQIPLITMGISFGATSPLLDIRLTPQQTVWEVSYPRGNAKKVQSVAVQFSMQIKDASSANFVASMLSIGTVLSANASLYGPLVIETPSRGQFFSQLTSKMVISLPPEVMSKAFSTLAGKLSSIITGGIIGTIFGPR